MKPLAQLERARARALVGILFDLDDTFLDGGVLTETAYLALGRLRRAGLRLVAVTGRPSGWGEVMARQWPLDGVVTENGAVALYRDHDSVSKWEPADEATRRARRVLLAQAFETLRGHFPEARLSDDTHARTSDIALDIGETQRVPLEVSTAIEKAARDLGLRTFVSSVHLHITLDPFDKASGTIAFLRDRFGDDATSLRQRYAYIGDSSNDAACFFAFSTSFGVANIKESLSRLSVPPRYVARAPKGAGFAEIADSILALR